MATPNSGRAESACSAGCQPAVSQVANLPGRADRGNVGAAEDARPAMARAADSQSATRQPDSLRHASRLRKTGGIRSKRRRLTLPGGWVLAAFLLWTSLAGLTGATPNAGAETETARVKRLYEEARAAYSKAPDNLDAGWHLGRACFDWAELAKTNPARAAIAEEGIAVCRRAVERKWSLGAAHYYLGLNLGQLARTKSLGALKLVREMEEALKATLEIDPMLDYAGAHRTLGLLYRDAPGWPTSLGSRSKARQQLQKAVELAPEYPDNRLSLLESLLAWNERKQIGPQLEPTEKSLADARTKFTGPEWQASWKDWNQRWESIKAKAVAPAASPPSPKRGN